MSFPLPDRAKALSALKERVRRLEAGSGHEGEGSGIDLGVAALATALPAGRLARARVHEVVGEARSEVRDAASNGFVVALLVRLLRESPASKPVLWLPRSGGGLGGGLYGHGLRALGLAPERLILVDAREEDERFQLLEEALACSGLAAAVAEFDPEAGTVGAQADRAYRRLQLAAERGGVTGFLLRPRTKKADVRAEQSSSSSLLETRWRVVSASSEGLGAHDWRPVWRVELERARRGRPGAWDLIWDAARGGFASLEQARQVAQMDRISDRTGRWQEEAVA